MLGHKDVWKYGYSFFLVASENSLDMQKQILRSVATAVRVAAWGDEKAWKEFMKD